MAQEQEKKEGKGCFSPGCLVIAIAALALIGYGFVMPGKDGLETAKGIRKIMPNVNIIMVTQNALDEGVKSQIGALDHILKPITVNKLESAFAKI